MRSFYIGLVLFLSAAMVVPAIYAQVEISGTNPKKFVQGDYPSETSSLPLDIYFNKALSDDINGTNIKARVKVYGRSEGAFEEIHTSGWTPKSRGVWIPTRLFKNKGFLQLKVSVDGHDSAIYNIPIAPAPSKPPSITKIIPDKFSVTDGSKAESISIYGLYVDPWGFSRVLIDGKDVSIGRVDLQPGEDPGGTVIAWMPKEYLKQYGTHTIQLVNRAGKSNVVHVLVGYIDWTQGQGAETKNSGGRAPVSSKTPQTAQKQTAVTPSASDASVTPKRLQTISAIGINPQPPPPDPKKFPK